MIRDIVSTTLDYMRKVYKVGDIGYISILDVKNSKFIKSSVDGKISGIVVIRYIMSDYKFNFSAALKGKVYRGVTKDAFNNKYNALDFYEITQCMVSGKKLIPVGGVMDRERTSSIDRLKEIIESDVKEIIELDEYMHGGEKEALQ